MDMIIIIIKDIFKRLIKLIFIPLFFTIFIWFDLLYNIMRWVITGKKFHEPIYWRIFKW